MRYEIKGDTLPVVICHLEAGERMITERGSMAWMSPNMKMETSTNGGFGKAFGRMFSGEAMFQNIYTAQGGNGLIAFASSFPGSIKAFEIGPGQEYIFQDKKGRLQSRRNGTAWILLAAAVWILLLGFIIYPIFIWKNPVLIAIFIPFFIALVPVYVVVTSRKSYRLKMDEKGCIRKFLFLSKRYLWKDLRVKLVASEESHCGEGVLFIKKKSGNSSSASETFSYASLHPYSSFVANFEVFGKMYGEKDALHEISKELFLEKMKEWGVEVEGLPKEEC